MNRPQRQALALLLGNAILCMVVAQINHGLSGWQLHLWPGGLLVAPAALQAGLGAGVVAVLAAGLALDAVAPVPFGTHAYVLLAGHAVLFSLRLRLARKATPVRVVMALLACGTTLLTFAVAVAGLGFAHAGAGRLLADLGMSLVATGLVAPWFFALQGRLLDLAQAGLRAEERWLD